MPAASCRRPGKKSTDALPTSSLHPRWWPRPLFVVVILLADISRNIQWVRADAANTTSSGQPNPDDNFLMRTYELVSTSAAHEKNKNNESKVVENGSSNELPAATKQYEYPILRPYGPIITAYPGRPPNPGWPSVEILDNHRNPPFVNPPFVTHKPSQHVMGNPMLSTVVVQDMSQSLTPRPPISVDSSDAVPSVDNLHHLGQSDIPLNDVQVVTKPLYGKPSSVSNNYFTDKFEESDLGNDSMDDIESDDSFELLENPPHLDMGGIVEDALKDVFKDKKVLKTTKEMLPGPGDFPVGPWRCPPVTCCRVSAKTSHRKCSSFVKCTKGGVPRCPPAAPERLPTPQALVLATQPPAGGTRNSTEKADVRDGEPRFKKKKIIKKKKKFLKKFLLPLLLAYKLLFLLIVPLLINGMMMMMSSSGMAGFFFALIGASVAMVRVYTGSMKVVSSPPPKKVVKVIKYVQTPVEPIPTTTPAPTTPPTTTVVYQPYEEHYPTYHAPPPPPPPPYGSFYPHPYMTRYYDRSGAFNGGRRKRRRRKDSILLNNKDFDRTLNDFSHHDYWMMD